MKNKDLYQLREALTELYTEKEYKGLQFSYFVIKNKKLIDSQIEIFDEILKTTELEEYDKERISMLSKYSTDKDGNVITTKLSDDRYSYVIQDEYKEDADNEFAMLREKYKQELESVETKYRDFNLMLEKEVDSNLQFTKIQFNLLPQNLSIKHLDSIFELVDM